MEALELAGLGFSALLVGLFIDGYVFIFAAFGQHGFSALLVGLFIDGYLVRPGAVQLSTFQCPFGWAVH